MNKELGDRIREIRRSKKYTQEQVADSIGMSRQRYARIEQGTSPLNYDVLSRISKFFDISVSDITRVLDDEPAVAYREGDYSKDVADIFDMLDLFYANKRLYDKLRK